MRMWPARRWGVALAVTVLAAVVIGVPTGVISTPYYSRMTPVLWWNYPVWLASSVLEGMLVATYIRAGASASAQPGAPAGPRTARAIGAGVLSTFAVGCPVCNKLVVMAIGVSGALSYWGPAQPVLAIASITLLGHAFVRRLRTEKGCAVPA